jgi:hypothetical protein
VGDLSAHVTIDALGSLFSPIKKIVELINTVFDVFLNPVPHVYCIKILCEYRTKLEALSPTDNDFKEKVEDILDQEESWLLWRRYWTYWDYRWKAWSIYYASYAIPELSVISKILRKNAFKFAVIHKNGLRDGHSDLVIIFMRKPRLLPLLLGKKTFMLPLVLAILKQISILKAKSVIFSTRW